MTYLRELSKASELTNCVRSPRLYSLDRLLLPNHEVLLTEIYVCYVTNSHSLLYNVSTE